MLLSADLNAFQLPVSTDIDPQHSNAVGYLEATKKKLETQREMFSWPPNQCPVEGCCETFFVCVRIKQCLLLICSITRDELVLRPEAATTT